MRPVRYGLRLQLVAIAALGLLMAMVIAESALVSLRGVRHSDDPVHVVRQSQRSYQAADLAHDALRAEVNGLLVRTQDGAGADAATIRDGVERHVARMRGDLQRTLSLPMSAGLRAAVNGLHEPLRSYAAAAGRLAEAATAQANTNQPLQTGLALRSFDRTFRRLELAQAAVTARATLAVERSEDRAAQDAAAAQRRIVVTSLVALAGMVLLTGLLIRMGRSLARLMSRQRSVAETLQHSLLPDRLPELPGMTFAARYVPGLSGAEVGGDWYDVIDLPTGEVGLIMGDVVGHDLHAASVMGQLRNALRAYALEGLSPAESLTRLNRFVRQVGHDEMATCVFAVFHPEAATLLVASAGHYPPLLIGADRESVFLEHAPCPPVGGVEHAVYTEKLYHVAPGSTVLLYTDGLIERRAHAIDAGLSRLQRVATQKSEDDVAAFCDRILSELFAGAAPSDDVALLALRSHIRLGDRLTVTVPAVAAHLAPLRHTVARWLSEAQATPEEVYELTVACGEAASNAVGHAYGPARATFELTAVIDGRVVDITVTDRGQWRPSRSGTEVRGRGIDVMKAFTDSMSVKRSEEGTTVRLRRALAPVAALEMWQGSV